MASRTIIMEVDTQQTIEQQGLPQYDEVDGGGDDVTDAKVQLTVDSAGRTFGDADPVPIHSCINIAVQTDDAAAVTVEHESEGEADCALRGCGGSLAHAIRRNMRMLVMRALVLLGIVIILVVIIVIQKQLGVEVISTEHILQTVQGELDALGLPPRRMPTSVVPPTLPPY